MMRHVLASLVLLLSLVTAAEARWCNSPFCRMCNKAFGPMSPIPQGVTLTPINHASSTQPYADYLKVDSTPQVAVDAMLKELNLQPDDLLYDIGCGDGRFLISAVQQYGCKALGIEIDPAVANLARTNVLRAGCGRVYIQTGNALDFDLTKATAVTMYLFPPLIKEILPKLSTTRVVSFLHPIPNRACRLVRVQDKYKIYVLESSTWNALPAKESWLWTN